MTERILPVVRSDRPGGSAFAVYAVLVRGVRLIMKGYLRIEIEGADRIPTSGGAILSPVHRSNIDFALPAVVSRRHVRWMAKDTIYVGGLINRFLVAMGSFPVRRDTIDRRSLKLCLEVVASGQLLVMFPEGRRREGDTIAGIFDGPAYVACRERVPIVPMGIGGSSDAMPIGAKWIRPRRVVVLVGEPLYPDVPAQGRVPRESIAEISDQLADALQDLYDRARAQASR